MNHRSHRWAQIWGSRAAAVSYFFVVLLLNPANEQEHEQDKEYEIIAGDFSKIPSVPICVICGSNIREIRGGTVFPRLL